MTLLLSLSLLNFIVIWIKFPKKFKHIILGFSLLLIAIYLIGNDVSNDSANYLRKYMAIENGIYDDIGIEILWFLFMKVCSFVQLDYIGFRFVIVLLSFCLLYHTIKYFNANLNLIVSIYMVVLLFIDSEQFRNFISFSFVVYGLVFLYQRKFIKYSIIILIASLIHSSALLYLTFLLIGFNFSKKTQIIYLLTFLFLTFLAIVSKNEINIYNLLAFLVKNAESSIYFMTNTNRSIYAIVLIFMVMLIVVFYINTLTVTSRNKTDIKNFFLSIVLLSAAFLPLHSYNIQFSRLLRNEIFILLILAGFSVNNLNMMFFKKIKCYASCLFVACIWIQFYNYVYGSKYDITINDYRSRYEILIVERNINENFFLR